MVCAQCVAGTNRDERLETPFSKVALSSWAPMGSFSSLIGTARLETTSQLNNC